MTSCTIGQGYYEGYGHSQRGRQPPRISTEADKSLSVGPKIDAKFTNYNKNNRDDINNDAQATEKENSHIYEENG